MQSIHDIIPSSFLSQAAAPGLVPRIYTPDYHHSLHTLFEVRPMGHTNAPQLHFYPESLVPGIWILSCISRDRCNTYRRAVRKQYRHSHVSMSSICKLLNTILPTSAQAVRYELKTAAWRFTVTRQRRYEHSGRFVTRD